jgi:hypothetical protein
MSDTESFLEKGGYVSAVLRGMSGWSGMSEAMKTAVYSG